MKKTEYIKQLKQLIKKYHPDLCNDEHLEVMYSEITKKLTSILNSLKAENFGNTIASENINTRVDETKLIKIKKQDYMYYKLGIKYYQNIHPDKFYKKSYNKNYETKTYDDQVSAINNIFLSFNLSEYYFRKVIEGYPQSPWSKDASDKIKLLKKLQKSYENIVIEENKITNYEQFVSEMGLKVI